MATTWCRLQLVLSRLRTVSLNQSVQYRRSLSSKTSSDEQQKEEYPDYEVSTEEFKFVERLLPNETVPEPPEHSSYPTPSGWVPPVEVSETPKYFVKRTRNHMLPIYLQTSHGGTRKLVMVRKVEGNIWAFAADIRGHLEKQTGRKIATQVHEVGRFVRVKGLLQDQVAEFLLEKGF